MNRRRKFLFLFLSATIVTSVTTMIGVAYAAYIYNNRYDNVVDFNTGSFSQHFNGGVGTEASPYSITEPDHLRSLQKLNVLGVFSKNTYFRLDNSFTWTGNDLNPIGTEDNPFYSQFEGNGKTITNLIVTGSQTSDIGMFGYVAMGSNIQNFILNAPLIKVNAMDNPSKISTTNPLANYLKTDAQTLTLSPDGTRKIFTPNKTAIVKDGVTFQIKFTSTDPTLLEWNNAQNRFNVKVPPNASTGKLYHVQGSAQVFAEYQGKVISHTLERWQFNVKHDGTVTTTATTDVKIGYWKTIYAGTNEGAGPHGTYVGFFVGHLDGTASYLGLYGGTGKGTSNGRIEVSGRAAHSYSILIGRTFDDNLNDDANGTLRHKNLNLEELNKANNTFSVISDNTFNNSSFYNNNEANALTASTHAGLDATEQTFMRLYPGNPATTYINKHDYQVIDEDNNSYEEKSSNTIRFKGGLKTYGYYHQGFLSTSKAKQGSQDAFWFYLSSNAVGSTFFTSTKDYEVTMRIRYTAKGDTANKFQILYNFWDLNATTSSGLLRVALENETWIDLSTNANADYDPNLYPVVQSYNNYGGNVTNPLFEHNINFKITKNGISLFNDRKFMFSIGAGSGAVQYTAGAGSRNRKTYFNLTNPNNDFELNIIGIDVTISSLDGNVNRQTTYVDYINNTPTFTPATGKWASWNGFANMRMHFNITDVITTNNGIGNYRFWRASGGGTPVVYYAETVTVSTGTGNWLINNTDGYRNGTKNTTGY